MTWEEKVAEIIWNVIKKFLPFIRKIKKPLSEIMKNSYDICGVADRLVHSRDYGLFIDAVVLCLAFNGGGKYKYYSLLAGDWKEWMFEKFQFSLYRRIIIDTEYSNLISEIRDEGFAERDLKTMHFSLLSAMYKTVGWEFVKYFYIDKTSEGVWHLLIASSDENAHRHFNDADHVHQLALAIKDIKEILEKHKN